MNKILLYIITSVLMFSSCTNEDYLKYDTSIKSGIYIEQLLKKENSKVEEVIDSAFYNFGFTEITEYTYNVRCLVMGTPQDRDREFKVVTNNSKYASEEFVAAKEAFYEIPSTVIMPKGAVETVIPIKLKRHAELAEVRAIITIELQSNENFEVKVNPEFTLTFDDKAPVTPQWWVEWEYGAFSKFKGQLFFKYFWEMEQKSNYIFELIVTRWGRNLDIGPFTPPFLNSPLDVYESSFKLYVQQEMWEYSESHPELGLDISKPIFYQ